MTENNIKELLSESFIQLLASFGGYKVKKVTPDDGGADIDMTYSYPVTIKGETYFIDSAEYIQFQLKTTTEKQIKIQKKYLKYQCRVSNYNKLVFRRNTQPKVPLFLALFILPDDKKDWLHVLSNHIKLKKHAYWFIPDLTASMALKGKESSVEIFIPFDNKFNLDTLKYLFLNYVPK